MTSITFWLNDPELETIIKKYKLNTELKYGIQLKQILLTEKKDEPIDDKIKRQLFLKHCLQNWKLLKESGHIFEEAKAIMLGKKEIEEPTLNFHKLQGQMCTFCNHNHSLTPPHVCTNLNCNCGIRN